MSQETSLSRHPDLDAVHQLVTELATRTGTRPSAIRVTANGLCVEVEWAHTDRTAAQSSPEPAPEIPDTSATAHIRAPAVGTFYRSPRPGADPFVKAGDTVTVSQQVGVVEAMKLMIPVEADTHGRILQVLVDDGAPVEFDQPLFGVEPDRAEAEDRRMVPSAQGGAS